MSVLLFFLFGGVKITIQDFGSPNESLSPFNLSGVIMPSSRSLAVTIDDVIGSASRTLISPNESPDFSLLITTCFILFSYRMKEKNIMEKDKASLSDYCREIA